MANPIPIQIRDQMATDMAATMKTVNGYQFTVGSINLYHADPQQGTWPKIYITIGDEINDDERRGLNNLLFNNDLYYHIYYEYKNSGVVDANESVAACEKMSEDLKRFFGNYYQVSASGALECFYKGHKKIFSNDATYPTGINFNVLIKYRQYRSNPAQYG